MENYNIFFSKKYAIFGNKGHFFSFFFSQNKINGIQIWEKGYVIPKFMSWPSSNQAIFCNTSNKGEREGCCNTLPRFSEPNPLWNWFWYQ